MRILLVALNSKYVHTNLALRYLREEVRAKFPEVSLREFSINEPITRIAAEIFEAKADVIGFSCYIWNLTETLAVIRRLRAVCPQTHFVLGGPEVSFAAAEFLSEHPEVDSIIAGEGEQALAELLDVLEQGQDLSTVAGLVWRKGPEVVVNPVRSSIVNWAPISSPYAGDEDLAGRLVYIETTRGCPFNCQYCLSSTFQGVRFMDPERFRLIFRELLAKGARTIKFVDRTFNVQKAHAMSTLDIVREEAQLSALDGIRIHCEIAGELLDEEWLTYLLNYPNGLLQMEVGVQSTYQPTLDIIARPQHFARWQKFVTELQETGQIPIHLDLIAGLPEEDWNSFRTSFNEVYAARPNMLQLGFLKVLKGSGLREKSEQYGLVYAPDPPYTVLQTNVLAHAELLRLQRLEDLLDKYYNSGKFRTSLNLAVALFDTPFDFYHQFAEFWHDRGWFRQAWHGKALLEKLWAFSTRVEVPRLEQLRDALRFDYYLWERPSLVPDYLTPAAGTPPLKEQSAVTAWQQLLRLRPELAGLVPEPALDRRRWARATAVAYFSSEVGGGSEMKMGQGSWYLFYYGGTKTIAVRLENEVKPENE